MRQFISTHDLSFDQLQEILSLAARGKSSAWRPYSRALEGSVVGLVFMNPSLRTRASFQAGIARLGGSSVSLSPGTETWNFEFGEGVTMDGDKPEHIKDAARVFSSYFDLVCLRAFPKLESWKEDRKDHVISALAEHLACPLVSMESALWHPCQALADALTLVETFNGELRGKTFTLTWAPHPKQLPMAVANSALLIAAQLGMQVRLACPQGYELSPEVLSLVGEHAAERGGGFKVVHDQAEALKGSHVVYAKSWAPPAYIGSPQEDFARRGDLASWMLTPRHMQCTAAARFMHCLPVRRNVEVHDAVLDAASSLIGTQIENRLHAQNALMLSLLRSDYGKS